jgi:hypothetical protein
MGTKAARILLFLAFSALIIILAVPIVEGIAGSRTGSHAADSGFQVAPVFKEFYELMGGRETLGPAISDLMSDGSRQCQFTMAAEICSDSLLKEEDRFSLVPLGKRWMQENQSGLTPDESALLDVYGEFMATYQRLGGTRYVGAPLTTYQVNSSAERIEQVFENLAMYRNFDEPAGTVHLLALGANYCSGECRALPAAGAEVRRSPEIPIYKAFSSSLENLGPLVFGSVLTEAVVAQDGKTEQVFEGIVAYAGGENSDQMMLRPLPSLVNIPAVPPGPQLYQGDSRMTFYKVEGDLGYNVPVVFDEFIHQHGGKKLSGQPISELAVVTPNTLFRQCFENYCLDYDALAAIGMNIRLAPLGQQYKDLYYPDGQLTAAPKSVSEVYTLYLSEKSPRITNTEMQEINLVVLRSLDKRPVTGLEATLHIFFPDGGEYTSSLPPTNSEGRTQIILPALDFVPNGTVLPYKACLTLPSQEEICRSESFLIWNFE